MVPQYSLRVNSSPLKSAVGRCHFAATRAFGHLLFFPTVFVQLPIWMSLKRQNPQQHLLATTSGWLLVRKPIFLCLFKVIFYFLPWDSLSLKPTISRWFNATFLFPNVRGHLSNLSFRVTFSLTIPKMSPAELTGWRCNCYFCPSTFQLMVNSWFGARWFGLLGFPNIQTTGPQTNNEPLVELNQIQIPDFPPSVV